MDFGILLAFLGFQALIGGITGALAARKGYAFVPWFLAGGVVGLIALSFQPFANSPDISEGQRIYLTDKGNTLGRNLAIIFCLLAVLRVLAGIHY